MVECPSCKEYVDEDATRCPYCKTVLPSKKLKEAYREEMKTEHEALVTSERYANWIRTFGIGGFIANIVALIIFSALIAGQGGAVAAIIGIVFYLFTLFLFIRNFIWSKKVTQVSYKGRTVAGLIFSGIGTAHALVYISFLIHMASELLR